MIWNRKLFAWHCHAVARSAVLNTQRFPLHCALMQNLVTHPLKVSRLSYLKSVTSFVIFAMES
ncbi:hypothetical protein [Helicobacter rodentium]|uniref:hypothetical protein n=1 Tax=Helicobacter rodentium TaxID=59617 RepID=UPI002355FB50|nr:hypothetical protein [Helicobacter rodentium]